jgi:uncharacterized membrane protein YfcA
MLNNITRKIGRGCKLPHDIPFFLFLGGALGSFIGAGRYSPQTMERVLGVVVIVAIVLLLRKVLPPATH